MDLCMFLFSGRSLTLKASLILECGSRNIVTELQNSSSHPKTWCNEVQRKLCCTLYLSFGHG